TDPGPLDSFTLSVNWGDPRSPGNAQTVTLGADPINAGGVTWDPATRGFTLQHQYLDNPAGGGSYTVGVTATDSNGDSGSAAQPVTVSNVAPTLALDPVAAVDEGGVATLSGTFADPGTLDTFTLTVNWGDGSAAQTVALAAGVRGFTLSHQYLD